MQLVRKLNPFVTLAVFLVVITLLKKVIPGIGTEVPFFLYSFGIIFISFLGRKIAYTYLGLSLILVEIFFQQGSLPLKIVQYSIFILVGIFIANIVHRYLVLLQKLEHNQQELEKANKKLKIQNDKIIELMDQALDYSPDRKRAIKK